MKHSNKAVWSGKKVFLNNELLENFWLYPNMKTLPNYMTQTRGKWNSLYWVQRTFERYENAMLFCVFIFTFLFWTKVFKEDFDENNFLHCYDDFLEGAILKVTWSHISSKFFLNNYDANWQWYLKDTLQLKILRK